MTVSPLPTAVMWKPLQGPGFEHLRLTAEGDETRADGLVVTDLNGKWQRFHYIIRVNRDWHIRNVELIDLDAAQSGLYLDADRSGSLRSTSRAIEGNGRAVDVDLAFTPFTNTLPIRKYQLEMGESKTIDLLYLTTPADSPTFGRQRYTRLPSDGAYDIYRFESLDTPFEAVLRIDDWGLVVDYPDLYQRVL